MLISEHKRAAYGIGCCRVFIKRKGASILFLLLLDETVQAVNKV